MVQEIGEMGVLFHQYSKLNYYEVYYWIKRKTLEYPHILHILST